MGPQSNGIPTVAPIVHYVVKEPGTNVVPLKAHPPQEALLGDQQIFIYAP